MKGLLVVLLLAFAPALAQVAATHPREGARGVAVLLADSGAVAWARTAQALATLGYRVQERDSAAGRLGTEAWFIEGQAQCLTSVEALVLGHTVLLTGTSYCPLFHHKPLPVYYSATSHVPFANFDCFAWGWAEVNVVARALGGRKTVWLPRVPRMPK